MNVNRRALIFAGFVGMLFIGALVWAKSDDPFRRIGFSVKTENGKTAGIIILPKTVQKYPVIIYLHGTGGSCLTDGRELRQWAELGFASVGFDYNQTNYAMFERQFSAVLEHIRQQPWTMPDHMAWIGYSLGAQRALAYCLRSTQAHPQLLVRMSGGWIDELNQVSDSGSNPGQLKLAGLKSRTQTGFNNQDLKFQVLLVHGELDEIFPASDATKLARLLASNGVPVDLKILSKVGHSFEPDRATVGRVIGEYCKARLVPDHPQPEFAQPHPIPFMVCSIPAFLWLITWLCLGCKRRKKAEDPPLTRIEIGLRAALIGLTTIGLAQTALHLILPRTEVSEQSLKIARNFLVPAQWKEDFEASASQSIWKGQRLGTLLDHVGLANYTSRELVNWQLDDSIYRNFVLSAAIAPGSDTEPNWRRPLWEFYYPRIRGEQTTTAAAEIIARDLRERVTIWPANGTGASNVDNWPHGIQTIWFRQITDPDGFERIYIAALRSVGIPARLDLSGKTEFWDAGQWHAAPRPPLTTWKDLNDPVRDPNSVNNMP